MAITHERYEIFSKGFEILARDRVLHSCVSVRPSEPAAPTIRGWVCERLKF